MRSMEESRDIWKRLNKPQCLDDYGLSITLEEMAQFQEGREALVLLPSQGVQTLHETTDSSK